MSHLEGIALGDQDAYARSAAMACLTRLPGDECLMVLETLLIGDQDPMIRTDAATLLPEASGDTRSVGSILSMSYAMEEDAGTRLSIVKALSRVNNPRASETLRIAATSDPDPECVASARRYIAARSASESR